MRAGLRQAGRSLIASIRTASPVPLSRLDPLPRERGARFLCLQLNRAGSAGGRRLCVGGKRPHRSLGLQVLNGAGKVIDSETVPASVKRPAPDKLVLTLVPSDAGLVPRRYEWRVVGRLRRKCSRGCVETLPGGGRSRAFRLRPVRAVGCTGGAATLVTNGPRDRDVVALTFDDGPS